MRERLITIDKSYKKEIAAITDMLDKSVTIHAESHTNTRYRIFTAESQSQTALINKFIAEILLTPMKFSHYVCSLAKKPSSIAEYSLLFAVMRFNSKEERKSLQNFLNGKQEIHVDGIFNFSMADLKNDWKDIARLINDLNETSPTTEDVAELIGNITKFDDGDDNDVRYYVFDDAPRKMIQSVIYYDTPLARISRSLIKKGNLSTHSKTSETFAFLESIFY